MISAVFPGTFDPTTKGHLDIAERSCKIFDEVIVGIYEDSMKQTLFSVEERIEMFKIITN